MAKTEPVEIEALDRQGRGLQAAFVWSGDGFHSTIQAVAPGTITPLLALDAATPIQEIVRHTLPDGQPTLLLTGAAAGRYWSGAIAAVADEHGARLTFDLACRRKDGVQTPAVQYRVVDGVVATLQQHGVALSTFAGAQFVIETTAPMALAGRELRIESPESVGETIQWRYAISITSSS